MTYAININLIKGSKSQRFGADPREFRHNTARPVMALSRMATAVQPPKPGPKQ